MPAYRFSRFNRFGIIGNSPTLNPATTQQRLLCISVTLICQRLQIQTACSRERSQTMAYLITLYAPDDSLLERTQGLHRIVTFLSETWINQLRRKPLSRATPMLSIALSMHLEKVQHTLILRPFREPSLARPSTIRRPNTKSGSTTLKESAKRKRIKTDKA